MKLFAKEKGIVFNILNAILVVWLMIGVVLTISNISDIVIKNHVYTYDEYKVAYCYSFVDKDNSEELVNENDGSNCRNEYALYKINNEDMKRDSIRYLIVSVSDIVLSGFVLFLLNKKGEK